MGKTYKRSGFPPRNPQTKQDAGVEMKNQITVLSAFVITGRGPDHISLKLDLPNAFTYKDGEPFAHASIDATAGTGAQYVRDHFGIEPQIVSLTT